MKEGELLSGLDSLFAEVIGEWSSERNRLPHVAERWQIFNASVVACLFVLQKVSSRNSLGSALQFLRDSKPGSGLDKLLGGSRRLRMKLIGGSTGGLCQARQRLSVEESLAIFERSNSGLARLNKGLKKAEEALQKGRWYLIDGSTIGVQNTAKIKEEFPALSNQNGSCQPCARVVFAHNLYDAIAQCPAIGAMTDSEQSLAKQVMDGIPRGSGVIGDRNFGVFSVAYSAQQRGLKVLVRLTEARAGALIGKQAITQDGTYNVAWTPSSRDLKTNSDIPATAKVTGKLTIVTVERYGYKSERMFLFTSDTSLTPEELVDTYKQRWLIENDIRTLKKTVNLDVIYSKTPDTVRKEILFGILAYNMIRALIAKGAAKYKLRPRDISFTRAVDEIRLTASHLSCAETILDALHIVERFYKNIYDARLPNRSKPRFEPRAVVSSRGSRFPTMKSRTQAKNKMIS